MSQKNGHPNANATDNEGAFRWSGKKLFDRYCDATARGCYACMVEAALTFGKSTICTERVDRKL